MQQELALTFCLSILRQPIDFFQVFLFLPLKWAGEQLPGSYLLSNDPSETMRWSPSSLGTTGSEMVLTLCANAFLLFQQCISDSSMEGSQAWDFSGSAVILGIQLGI